MEQPDILKDGVPKKAGTHNAWIGHAAAGGYDLRSEYGGCCLTELPIFTDP